MTSNSRKFSTLSLLLPLLIGLNGGSALCSEEFGPVKPKTIETPFSVSDAKDSSSPDASSLDTVKISIDQPLGRRLLGSRLRQSKLYLPDKMVLGRVAEFTVKGKPGLWVALAMADKDTGSKPLMGHPLRLGADRKVMAVAQIPASGVATLLVECPVEGDLVGSYLYFEAAIWSEDHMPDLEIASCSNTEGKPAGFNGVLIQPQFEQKKGIRIVPTTTSPFLQGQQQGLSSQHP